MTMKMETNELYELRECRCGCLYMVFANHPECLGCYFEAPRYRAEAAKDRVVQQRSRRLRYPQ